MPSDDIPAITKTASKVVAGVETHKDLHVAAIVDTHDHVMATESFASTRHGYNCMLTWMRSFGALDGVGIECAGTYGAGLSCSSARRHHGSGGDGTG